MNEKKSRNLGWEDILSGLAQLSRENPAILERNALVGGAACFFYRDQLKQINDPDFPAPAYAPEQEKLWLSHDADFATNNPEEIPNTIGKLPLGTLQCGSAAIGADAYRENARKVTLTFGDTEFTMLIADPLDLWREKDAIIHRITRPQDGLHLKVLELFLQWELAHYAEGIPKGHFSPDRWIARAKEVKMRYSSIFNSQKLRDRLIAVGVPEITNFVTGS